MGSSCFHHLIDRLELVVANSDELLTLKDMTMSLPSLDTSKEDSILWIPSSTGNFTVKSAWNFIQDKKELVPWRKLVWFLGKIPRTTFCLWLAIRRRLGTQDRIHQPVLNLGCLLCGEETEDHDHLFFKCRVSNQLWTGIATHGGFHTPQLLWEYLIVWMRLYWQDNSLGSKIKKL